MMGQEKIFEVKLRKYFESKGAWVLKTWSNGIQRSGVPDLIICYKGRFIALEVKAPHGRASELPLWNLTKISEAGGCARVIYPKDFETLKQAVEELDND